MLRHVRANRFAQWRDASDWIRRIEQVADAGARKLWVGLRATDMASQLHYMRILGKEIMPRFV